MVEHEGLSGRADLLRRLVDLYDQRESAVQALRDAESRLQDIEKKIVSAEADAFPNDFTLPRAGTTARAVAAAVAGGANSIRTICADVDASYDVVRATASALVGQGVLTRQERGRYECSPVVSELLSRAVLQEGGEND